MMINTRLPVERLIDWTDQAVLILLLDEGDDDVLDSRVTDLRALGIRTATDLLVAAEMPAADQPPPPGIAIRSQVVAILGHDNPVAGEELLTWLAAQVAREPSIAGNPALATVRVRTPPRMPRDPRHGRLRPLRVGGFLTAGAPPLGRLTEATGGRARNQAPAASACDTGARPAVKARPIDSAYRSKAGNRSTPLMGNSPVLPRVLRNPSSLSAGGHSRNVADQHRDQALQGHRVPRRRVRGGDRRRPEGQVVGLLLLPGRLHLRLPHRAGRPGRHLRRVPAARRRGLQRLDRHALHAQGLARRLGHDQEDPVPDGRRPDRRHHPQLRRADRGSRPRGPRHVRRRPRRHDQGRSRSTTTASAATPTSCCARSRPRSTSRAPGRGLPGQVDAGEKTLAPSLDLVGKI